MSTENAASSPDPAGAQASTLQSQVQALEDALSATRKTRLLILILVLLLFGGVALLLKGVWDRLQSQEYLDELGNAAQEHLKQNESDFMDPVKNLVDRVSPEVSKAFYKRVKDDTPRYMRAVQDQRELLMQNVQARLEEQINLKYKETLNKYEGILKEEFPKAEDDIVRKRLMANLEQSLQKMVEEFYVAAFKREMQTLYDTWDEFPQADPAGPEDDPLSQQLIGSMMEIMVLQASGRGSLAAMVEEEEGETNDASPGGEGTNDEAKPEASGDAEKESEEGDTSEAADSSEGEAKE